MSYEDIGFLYYQQKMSCGLTNKKYEQKHEKFTFREIGTQPANPRIADQGLESAEDRRSVWDHGPASKRSGAEMGMARTSRKNRGGLCPTKKRSNTSKSYPQTINI